MALLAAAEDVHRCVYVVAKRRRRCHMVAAKDSEYCGEHLMLDKSLSVRARTRILCPLDASHTVYEDVLHKHLKVCNVTKRPLPLGYSRGINIGHSSCLTSDLSLSSCPAAHLEELVQRVEAVFASHVTSMPMMVEVLVHPSMEANLSDPNNGVSARKHLVQQASILGHLQGCGLLGSTCPASCYIEFGAGRAKLTGRIHQAVQFQETGGRDMVYILVDKASCRRKVDGVYSAAKLHGATCHRLLMDIADLDLGRVDAVKGCGLVGVSKHLCGAATDLAIRCLLRTLPRQQQADCRDEGSKANKESAMVASGTRLLGVAMAMCCHHRCSWSALVGGDFLEGYGFTPADFSLICHMTSWAVCGVRPPAECKGEEVEGRRWGYVPHGNEGVGLKCKRLIDLARVHYLQKNGMKPRLLYYVERTTSLENVLLIALPK